MKIFIILIVVTNVSLAETCDEYYIKKLVKISLNEFIEEFSSEEFKREVSNKNYCYREKVQLMEDYYYANESSRDYLKQRLADGWGFVGDYDKAIEWSYKQLNGDKSTPWNNYIFARIAYFKNNEAEFVEYYNLISDDPDYTFGNAMMITWLEMLIENFDKPYRYIVENADRDE